jgi:CheY-like chemotaxis protein
MMRTKKIVWIDDNPDRGRTADELGAEFINVRGADLAETVAALLSRPQPSLVILDHILDKTATKNPLFKRGSTIAEAIKEQWADCPVVGVTNADNVKKIDVRTQRTYDALFPFSQFGAYAKRIEAIRQGFLVIAKTKAQSARVLVDLMKPPEDELERLVSALPDDLKKSFQDASVASRLYSWVDRLMDRPGFLYDRLWAATLLGLNESGFQKVCEQFKKARYAGVFSADDYPRWWSNRLTELLHKRSKPESEELSWHAGRRLRGIKKEHYSRCYVCGEEFPDTVAFLDAVSDEQRAMHLKCTALHPRYKRELYFEDIRMMREG